MELDLPLTVILTIVSALFTVLFGYMGARPMNPKKGPRMVPWRFLMMLTFTFSLFLIIHVLSLLGFHTAQPPRY